MIVSNKRPASHRARASWANAYTYSVVVFTCSSLPALERALGFAGRFHVGVRAHSLLAAAVVEELDVVGVDFQPHVRIALGEGVGS